MEPPGRPSRVAEGAYPRIVQVGDDEFEVAAPTVQQAVEVLEILEAVAAGDVEDFYYLRRRRLPLWCPPDFLKAFDLISKLDQARLLRHLLYWGAMLPEPDESSDSDRAPEDEVEPDDYADLLCTYCAVFGSDPWTVWTTMPFPFFLTVMGRVDRHMARLNLRNAEVALLPHAGKRGNAMLKSIKARAGFRARKLTEADYEKDRDALERFARRMAGAPA